MPSRPSKPKMPPPPIVASQADIAQGQDDLIRRLSKLRAGMEGLKAVPYGLMAQPGIRKERLGD